MGCRIGGIDKGDHCQYLTSGHEEEYHDGRRSDCINLGKAFHEWNEG